MGQQVDERSKPKQQDEEKEVSMIRPETEWSKHEQEKGPNGSM